MIVICHLDRLSFPPTIFRDASPTCPLDKGCLNESQVTIDNVSKHFYSEKLHRELCFKCLLEKALLLTIINIK